MKYWHFDCSRNVCLLRSLVSGSLIHNLSFSEVTWNNLNIAGSFLMRHLLQQIASREGRHVSIPTTQDITIDKGAAMLQSRGGGANGSIASERFGRLAWQIAAKLGKSSWAHIKTEAVCGFKNVHREQKCADESDFILLTILVTRHQCRGLNHSPCRKPGDHVCFTLCLQLVANTFDFSSLRKLIFSSPGRGDVTGMRGISGICQGQCVMSQGAHGF